MRRNIESIFNKFAGREVPMVETEKTMRIGCVIKHYKGLEPAPDDATIKEMNEAAVENGLTLRVLCPGKGYTDDYVRTRVNAHIEKGRDGKYHVARKFDIG